MTALRGIFILVPVPGALGARLADIQRVHDPRLAALWAPHLTLIGSSGAGPIHADTPVEQLRAALAPVAAAQAPLTLPFGAPQRFPGRDIVVLPLSPHGPLRALHEALRATGLPTHPAKFPFTPHVTLTMYPPLSRERERQLLALREPGPLRVDRLQVFLTREPQPAQLLLDLPLGGAGTAG
jgi:2'-5' RNA ligase